MDYLCCKACKCDGVLPMQLEDTGWEWPGFLSDAEGNGDRESTFFSCQVCGDNWLSVKDVAEDGVCQITFIHQMGTQPHLKRVALMQTHVVLVERTVENWEYYLGDDPVKEDDWRSQLFQRRAILRAISTN